MSTHIRTGLVQSQRTVRVSAAYSRPFSACSSRLRWERRSLDVEHIGLGGLIARIAGPLDARRSACPAVASWPGPAATIHSRASRVVQMPQARAEGSTAQVRRRNGRQRAVAQALEPDHEGGPLAAVRNVQVGLGGDVARAPRTRTRARPCGRTGEAKRPWASDPACSEPIGLLVQHLTLALERRGDRLRSLDGATVTRWRSRRPCARAGRTLDREALDARPWPSRSFGALCSQRLIATSSASAQRAGSSEPAAPEPAVAADDRTTSCASAAG